MLGPWLPGVVEIATEARAPGPPPSRGSRWAGGLAVGGLAVVGLLAFVPGFWGLSWRVNAALGPAIFAAAALLALPLLAREHRDFRHTRAALFVAFLALTSALAAWSSWPHALVHAGLCRFEGFWVSPYFALPIVPIWGSFLGVIAYGAQGLVLRGLRGRSSVEPGLRHPPRWLAPLLLLVAVTLVVLGGVSRLRPEKSREFSGYLAGLEVVGRLPAAPERQAKIGDWEGPWLARPADLGPVWVAPLEDLDVCSHEWVSVVPRGQQLSWERLTTGSKNRLIHTRGGTSLLVRRDRQRDLIFIEQEGTRSLTSHDDSGRLIALRGPVYAPTSVEADELFGPGPLPLSWVLLAAAGLVGAAAALRRERGLLRVLDGGGLAGQSDEHGAIELPGASASYPPGARVVAGPVVVLLPVPVQAATYRASGGVGPALVVPGTPDEVAAAATEARWNAITLALAVLALTTAPLAVAVVSSLR